MHRSGRGELLSYTRCKYWEIKGFALDRCNLNTMDKNLTLAQKKKYLTVVNALLNQFAHDEDLRDDLRDDDVRRAIKHWTNEVRLAPEDALALQENYRVTSVFEKFMKLHHACKSLRISFPLDHFILRKPCLSDEILLQVFGDEMLSVEEVEDTSFGPQPVAPTPVLPNSSSGTFQRVLKWGKESPASEEYNPYKSIVRSLIEIMFILMAAVVVKKYFVRRPESAIVDDREL